MLDILPPNARPRADALTILLLGLLPVLAITQEFLWRFHPLVAMAHYYACALVLWVAWRHYRDAKGSAGEANATALLAVGAFAAVFLGALKLAFALGAGGYVKAFKLPLDPDILWYALALLAWFITYFVLRRHTGKGLDYFLAWSWRAVDIPLAIALCAATWAALDLYLKYNGASHEPMAMFGVRQGSVPPWVYFAMGLLFTTSNALMEELWFRGLLLPALDKLLRPWPAALLCGLVFGLTHWFGTPQGVLGVVLAGCWGVVLSYWTIARRCLWQALSVHLLADFIIWLRTN